METVAAAPLREFVAGICDALWSEPASDETGLIFPEAIFLFFKGSGAGNDPASKITITLATTSATAGNRF